MSTPCRKGPHELVELLRDAGVNFLAVDFDLTLVDVHTGGQWQGSAGELGEHVRSTFRELLPLALEASINVAIVTFSPQTELIRAVICEAFGREAERRIVVRGQDGSWSYRGSGDHNGKQAHMASAAQEVMRRTGCAVARKTTLLIDDDMQNVQAALDNYVPAVLCKPDRPQDLERDIAETCSLYIRG